MTEEEYALTSNLTRLRMVSHTLACLHECAEMPPEKVSEMHATVHEAIRRHEDSTRCRVDF
jgi:hypothetical protein